MTSDARYEDADAAAPIGATLVRDNSIPAGRGGGPAVQTGVPGSQFFVRTPAGAALPNDVRTAAEAEVGGARVDDVLITIGDATFTTVGVTSAATPFWGRSS